MVSRLAPGAVMAPAGNTARAAWAGSPPSPDAARERLLGAAARCIARDGLAATSVASVAAEAGVSRPTVYRYFDDRDTLVRAALHSAAAELGARVRGHLARFAEAGDMAVEVVALVVAVIPTDPVLRAIWNSTALDATVVERFTDATAVAWVRSWLDSLIAAAGWDDAEADEAVEVILRLVLSFLVTRAPERDIDQLVGFLRRRLLPALGLAAPTPTSSPPTPTSSPPTPTISPSGGRP